MPLKPLCCNDSGPCGIDAIASRNYPEEPYLTLPNPERFRLPSAAMGSTLLRQSVLSPAVVAVVGSAPLILIFRNEIAELLAATPRPTRVSPSKSPSSAGTLVNATEVSGGLRVIEYDRFTGGWYVTCDPREGGPS